MQVEIGMIGTDYSNTSFNSLEKFVFDEKQIREFTQLLPANAPVKHFVILSTCNRVEIYFTCVNYQAGLEWLMAFVCDFQNQKKWASADYFYRKQGNEAIQHLFEVAAGLKSMVKGENEILGQLKHAYGLSQTLCSTETYLNKLFQTAIHLGKFVRQKTNISKGAHSVSSVAITQLQQSGGDFLEKKILVIGAGVMAQRAIRHLQAIGHTEVYVTTRSKLKLNKISESFGIATFDYQHIKKAHHSFDILYFATAAKEPILQLSDLTDLAHTVQMVDIGLPRNIAANIAQHALVDLICLDELNKNVCRTLEMREESLPKVKAIIDEKFAEYQHWMHFKLSDNAQSA